MTKIELIKQYLTPLSKAEFSKSHVTWWWIQRTLQLFSLSCLLFGSIWIIFWFGSYGWKLATEGQDVQVTLIKNHVFISGGRYGNQTEYSQTVRLPDGRLAYLSLSPCPADTLPIGAEIPIRWLDMPSDSWYVESQQLERGGKKYPVQRAIWLALDGSEPSLIEYLSPHGAVFSGIALFFLALPFLPSRILESKKTARKKKKKKIIKSP